MILLPSQHQRGQRRPRLREPRCSCALFASAMPPPSHVSGRCCRVDHAPTLMRARHGGAPVGGDARLCPYAAGRDAPSRRRCLLSVADDSHTAREGGPVMRGAVGQVRRASLRQGACCVLTTPRRDPRSRMRRAAACTGATSPCQPCLPSLSCPCDRGRSMQGYAHLYRTCVVCVPLRTLAKLPRLLVILYRLR
jgi:hypothetical protein